MRLPTATKRSLYPSSSSVCKHYKLGFRCGATRGICSPNRGDHSFVLQVQGSDLVRSARHNLLGGEDTVLDEPAGPTHEINRLNLDGLTG